MRGDGVGVPVGALRRAAARLAQRVAAGDEPSGGGDREGLVQLRAGPRPLGALRGTRLHAPPDGQAQGGKLGPALPGDAAGGASGGAGRDHGGCAGLRPVYLGDDLYACQPVCRAMLDCGGDFLLTAKPDSHKTLFGYLDGIRLRTRRTTSGTGTRRRIHRYRWMTDLPVRDGDDALRVNWLGITSARPDGTVTYRGTFVTSLDVNRDNVAELADCARARWKIENETFNVLKQHGYHLEHNFGHGKDTLASVLVVLNLLAFALHAACDLSETQWHKHDSGSARESACSGTCAPSPPTRSSPRGTRS